MSTLLLVLYIFIALVVLLCVVSFVMYMCHLCSGVFDTVKLPRIPFLRKKIVYAPDDERPLNEVRQTSEPSTRYEQVELTTVQQRVQNYQHEHTSQPVGTVKPSQPVKPLVHSQPSSKRNSLVKPKDAPPPPPAATGTTRPLSQGSPGSFVLKPKKAPPPPPPTAVVKPHQVEVVYDTPEVGTYLRD